MRVDVNGTGIEVDVVGEGRPVVLLHGFPDSGRCDHWMQLEAPDAVNRLLLDFLPA